MDFVLTTLLFVTLDSLSHVTGQSTIHVYDQPCDLDPPKTRVCKSKYHLQCAPTDYSEPKCRCETNYIRYTKMLDACVKPEQQAGDVPHGGSCKTEGCAGDDLLCAFELEEPTCGCPETKPVETSATTCGLAHGVQCTTSSDCGTNMECKSSSCHCEKDHVFDGKMSCRMKMLGECSSTEDCLPNAVCTSSKCLCAHNYVLSEDMKCESKFVPAGGSCKDKDDCLPQKDLLCVDDKCACQEDYEWVERTCQAKANLPQCDPEAEVDSCTEDEAKNMVCDKEKQICVCPEDTDYSDSAKACKLNAGQDCTVPAAAEGGAPTYEHGLCLSEHCSDGSDKETPLGICDCPQGSGGQRRIWASDPGRCVDDKFGLPCISDKDCIVEDSTSSLDPLMCLERRCICAVGYTYQQAYCLKDADARSHNEPCGPKGSPACNVTGTGLACRGVTKKEHRCICLPKETRRTTSSTRRFVNTEWDTEMKKCTLKAEGKRCGDGAECRRGRCPKGICDASVKAKSDASTCVGPMPTYVALMAFEVILRRI